MNWLTLLTIAALIAAIAAITGFKPKGSRPVARTQLMGVARVVLVLLVLAIAYYVVAMRS